MVVELESSTSSEHAAEKIKSAKKKSRKSKEDLTGNVVEAETVVKKEKRKRKAAEAEQLEGEEDGVAEVKQDKPKKRKKHTDIRAEEDTTSGVVDEDATKHKKKRKRRDPEDTSAGPSDTSELLSAEASKSKHKIPKPEKELKKKKKRKHSEHSFKDPSADESLSEQASKALSYAYTQADDLPNWKFNKARQNWLIRNILSEENIPEEYVPLVHRYMSGVQGGAREALIKSCREITTKQSEVSNADKKEVPSTEEQSEEKSQTRPTVSFQPTTREQRARDLLGLLTQDIGS